MKKKIFIITGEESGDKLASIIFSRLDITNYEIKAIGGENLKSLNFPIIFDNKKITFFGITDVIKNIDGNRIIHYMLFIAIVVSCCCSPGGFDLNMLPYPAGIQYFVGWCYFFVVTIFFIVKLLLPFL